MAGPRVTRAAPAAYDAVVVGGGHNGLVAAAYLARAGLRVLVLERRDAVGGAAVSQRPFEGVDARLSGYAYLVSLLPRRIVSDLGLDVRLRRRPVSSYTPDPRAGGAHGLLVDRGDRAATRASFARITGGDGDFAAWERFYAGVAGVARRIFPTLTEPLRTRAQLRRIAADDAVWEALVEAPLGASVATTFADDLVRGVVLTDALIGTFAGAGDPELRQNRCFLYHVIGRGTGDWLVPVGGMGSLTAALRDAALAAGAELRTRAEVTAIGAGEVRYADGAQRSVGTRFVLAAIAPAELDRLRGRTPQAPAPEGSQLKLNLVLARLPRLHDPDVAPARAFAGTLHVNETATQLQAAHDEARAGAIPRLPPCEAYCHTLTDRSILGPGLARTAAQTLTVFALHMPARLFAAAGARERALDATLRSLDSVLAEPVADCLLHDAGGAPCIEARTPLDLERELRMPGGHIFHRDLAWPFADDEADAGRWGVETDDPSILLCGAGARRGGGVSAIPGHNAAMAVLASPQRRTAPSA